jgi:hypothetical protein
MSSNPYLRSNNSYSIGIGITRGRGAGSSVLPSLSIDTSAHTPPTTDPRPAYLTPYTDPTYGTLITRISADPGAALLTGTWGTINQIPTPQHRFSFWNADETQIYVPVNTGGSAGLIFLNGSSYSPTFLNTAPSGWIEGRWDRNDPTRMVYINSSNQLRYYTVSSGATSLIRDFTGTYSAMSMGDQSWDGDTVALMATRTSDTHAVAISYKISTNTVIGVVDITALTKTITGGHLDISANANYMYMYFSDETSAVYTIAGVLVNNIAAQQPNHGASSLDEYGEEVIVGTNRGVNGHIIKRRMSDNAVFEINPNSFAYNTSTSNYKQTGVHWVVNDYYSDSGSPYVSELNITSLDGQMTGRIAHNQRGANIDGNNAPQSSLSPTGGRALFSSTWRDTATPSRPAGLYVADWRNFQLPLKPDLISNGGFVTNTTGWTLNTGWSRVGSVVSKTTGNTNTLTQPVALVNGATYSVQYTITAVSASSVTVSLSGGIPVAGTARSTVGTFTETIVNNSSGNNAITFTPTGTFVGSIDNIKLWKTS